MGHVNGYWRPVTYGKKGPKFLGSGDAGRWANRHYGLGMWTLEWLPKEEL